jgi:hypothetical protein
MPALERVLEAKPGISLPAANMPLFQQAATAENCHPSLTQNGSINNGLLRSTAKNGRK